MRKHQYHLGMLVKDTCIILLIKKNRSRQSGAQDQAVALQAEGVRVVDNRASGSGFTVDFEECGWFPNRLPSEEEEEDEYLVNTDMNH